MNTPGRHPPRRHGLLDREFGGGESALVLLGVVCHPQFEYRGTHPRHGEDREHEQQHEHYGEHEPALRQCAMATGRVPARRVHGSRPLRRVMVRLTTMRRNWRSSGATRSSWLA